MRFETRSCRRWVYTLVEENCGIQSEALIKFVWIKAHAEPVLDVEG